MFFLEDPKSTNRLKPRIQRDTQTVSTQGPNLFCYTAIKEQVQNQIIFRAEHTYCIRYWPSLAQIVCSEQFVVTKKPKEDLTLGGIFNPQAAGG